MSILLLFLFYFVHSINWVENFFDSIETKEEFYTNETYTFHSVLQTNDDIFVVRKLKSSKRTTGEYSLISINPSNGYEESIILDGISNFCMWGGVLDEESSDDPHLFVILDVGEGCRIYFIDPDHEPRIRPVVGPDGQEYEVKKVNQRSFKNHLFMYVELLVGEIDMVISINTEAEIKEYNDPVAFSDLWFPYTLKEAISAFLPEEMPDFEDPNNDLFFVTQVVNGPDPEDRVYTMFKIEYDDVDDKFGIDEVEVIDIDHEASLPEDSTLVDYMLFFVEDHCISTDGSSAAKTVCIHDFSEDNLEETRIGGIVHENEDYNLYFLLQKQTTTDNALRLMYRCSARECEKVAQAGEEHIRQIEFGHSEYTFVTNDDKTILTDSAEELYSVADEEKSVINLLEVYDSVVFFSECTYENICDIKILRVGYDEPRSLLLHAESVNHLTNVEMLLWLGPVGHPFFLLVGDSVEENNLAWVFSFSTDEDHCTPKCNSENGECDMLTHRCICKQDEVDGWHASLPDSEQIFDCSVCMEDYYGGECKQFCDAEDTCNSHGSCEEKGDVVECDCNDRFDPEKNCAVCKYPFSIHLDQCVSVDCGGVVAANASVCSGNGECNAVKKKVEKPEEYTGECKCRRGWKGANCNEVSGGVSDNNFMLMMLVIMLCFLPVVVCFLVYMIYNFYFKKRKDAELRARAGDIGPDLEHGGTFVELGSEEEDDDDDRKKQGGRNGPTPQKPLPRPPPTIGDGNVVRTVPGADTGGGGDVERNFVINNAKKDVPVKMKKQEFPDITLGMDDDDDDDMYDDKEFGV